MPIRIRSSFTFLEVPVSVNLDLPRAERSLLIYMD